MISQESHETGNTAADRDLEDASCAEQEANTSVAGTLRSVQEEVLRLKAQLADRFLALTGSLRSISEQARDIAARSQQGTTAGAADQTQLAIGKLQKVLENAEQVRTLGDSSIGPLREILGHLREARAPLSRLTGLPFLLNTVGMLSRIEASRMGNASSEVCSLADDIATLAAQIERHVSAVMAEADRLPTVITQSVASLEDMNGQQQQQAEDLMDRAHDVLEPLHARAKASRTAAAKTAEQYTGIRGATDKIVMSLQCDDIARQRLEHVEQGLAQASELERAGDLQACAGIVTLQKSQLLSTRTLLSDSLRAFLSSVKALSSHLEQLTADTTAFANQTDQDGQSIANVMENGLRAVSSVYGQYSTSAQAIVSTVEALLPSVSGMSNGANELKKIAASIRRTALNARIETSHLGTEGATLRVLAGEVQQITEDSDQETQSILGHLTAINQELTALSSRCEASGTATTMSANLGGELSALIESVEASSRQMSAGLRVLLEKSAALVAELRETRALAEGSLQTAQDFDKVLQQLEGIVEQMRPAPGTAFASEAEERTSDLAQMYSMQSERDIHNLVFGGAPQPQGEDADLGGDVELF